MRRLRPGREKAPPSVGSMRIRRTGKGPDGNGQGFARYFTKARDGKRGGSAERTAVGSAAQPGANPPQPLAEALA